MNHANTHTCTDGFSSTRKYIALYSSMGHPKLLARRALVSEELPKIIERGHEEVNRKVLPRFDRMMEALDIVKTLLIERKRILYGGPAIHFALIAKDPKLAIYRATDFPDIDAYSPDPMGDLKELIQRLTAAGFGNVRAEQAFHVTTYKLKCEKYVSEVADITYCWSRNFHRIPFETNKEGLRYAAPSFQVIDLYKTWIDPILGWQKIEKNVKRATLLEDSYLYHGFVPPKQRFDPARTTEVSLACRAKILGFLIGRKDCVLVGAGAYNCFIRYGRPPNWQERLLKPGELEVYAADAPKFVQEVLDVLALREYTVEKYRPLLEFYRGMHKIVVGGVSVLSVFSDDDLCIPFQMHDKMQIGSYHLVLRMLYIQRWVARLDSDSRKRRETGYMIDNIQFSRELWLTRRQRTGTEPGLMQELQAVCMGDDLVSPFTKYVDRRLQGHHIVIEAGRRMPDLRFPNTSGRKYSELLPGGIERKTIDSDTGKDVPDLEQGGEATPPASDAGSDET